MSRSNGFPLVIVLRRPRLFRREYVKREVRVGKYWVDFGNDIKRAIEVDGKAYHMDIIKDQERDEYIQSLGWSVLRIRADELLREPERVRRRVISYLLK